jgi:cytidyltransferase-like protein
MKKVFVSGCFDLLHSGHIHFLETCSQYGDLYVCIGSDSTIYDLKGRYPINNEDERKYMINSLKFIKECRISTGNGILDFLNELNDIKPDIFIVNEDGSTPNKESLCKELGIKYLILKREPKEGLPIRSTTSLRTKSTIPFRIDLAGGWLDQPYVNKFYRGSVLTVSIEPTIEFNDRSGMSSSTRNKAIELWGLKLPHENPIKISKVLFGFENPSGTKTVAGSQDSLGIVLPGLNKLTYSDEDYWPNGIESINDEDVLNWLENHIYLIPLNPRFDDYDVLSNTDINLNKVMNLSKASENCWGSILKKDLKSLGKYFTESFMSQISMFPNMVDESIMEIINEYKDKCLGYKLSGAGGGGYLILIHDSEIENSIKIKIRRN